MDFSFRFNTALVDNRAYDYSELTRMCQSIDVEVNIPWTEYHYLVTVNSSLLPWLAKPDAWQVDTDGWPTREKVFEYAEWVECSECGEEVVNDDMDDHIRVRHEGEYDRFYVDRTKDEYDEY